MEPRGKPRSDDEVEAPTREQQDWDAIKGAKILPDSVAEEDGIEKDGELPDEDDDHAIRTALTKPPSSAIIRSFRRSLSRAVQFYTRRLQKSSQSAMAAASGPGQ